MWIIVLILQSMWNDEEERKQRQKNKEIFTAICWFVSREWLDESYLNWNVYGGQLHCKFGAIWKGLHWATDDWYTNSNFSIFIIFAKFGTWKCMA